MLRGTRFRSESRARWTSLDPMFLAVFAAARLYFFTILEPPKGSSFASILLLGLGLFFLLRRTARSGELCVFFERRFLAVLFPLISGPPFFRFREPLLRWANSSMPLDLFAGAVSALLAKVLNPFSFSPRCFHGSSFPAPCSFFVVL